MKQPHQHQLFLPSFGTCATVITHLKQVTSHRGRQENGFSWCLCVPSEIMLECENRIIDWQRLPLELNAWGILRNFISMCTKKKIPFPWRIFEIIIFFIFLDELWQKKIYWTMENVNNLAMFLFINVLYNKCKGLLS